MRVAKLYPRIALLACLALAAGCQSAHHSANLLSSAPQANAPALQAAATSTPASQTGSAPAVPALKPAPKPDPVTELISKVDKEYQAGQASFNSGNQKDAKAHFEAAYDLLMNSSLDLHSDPRLQKEYDQVLAGVNSTMQAMDQQEQSGSDQADQKAEPAPIDEANEATPPVDESVKAKAEAEVKSTHSDLPLMLTDPVVAYINYFSTRGHEKLEQALARSGRYQPMISRVLKQEGVPQDLMYLALAESGFHPLALSRVGARGMWQFMGSRAKAYGLKRNGWVDEREDPEKSTIAAAHHLKDLYNEFGDWYLAMAAYNSGPGTVQQAVKRTGYADFWQLYDRNVLPRETKNYVPIILAVAIMAKNPAQYGLDGIVKDDPITYDTVNINYPVDLRLVAQCVDVPVTTIQELNPSLLRWSTPENSDFDLHLPKGTAGEYQTAIAAIPEDMRIWWRYYDVSDGDTLASISHTYHVTEEAILKANNLDDGSDLQAGSKLIIPTAPGRYSVADVRSYTRRATRYHVRRGDSVESVAANFGVPPRMVRRWNYLRGNSLRGRRILYIHLPVMPKPEEVKRFMAKASIHRASSKSKIDRELASNKAVVHHRVRPGETLYSIANAYNTSVNTLKRENGIVDVAALRAGTVLIIRANR
jgi:peptidoglycan lytic transglycosylase D